MANFTSFVEPNLWDLARTYGGQAAVIYCSQLISRTGTDELLNRAASSPYSPTLAAELAEARRFFVGRGCVDVVRLIDATAASLAQRIPSIPLLRPLGRRAPAGSSSIFPGAPGSAARIRALLAYEMTHDNRPRFVEVLRAQLAAAEAREAGSAGPPSISGRRFR